MNLLHNCLSLAVSSPNFLWFDIIIFILSWFIFSLQLSFFPSFLSFLLSILLKPAIHQTSLLLLLQFLFHLLLLAVSAAPLFILAFLNKVDFILFCARHSSGSHHFTF
uniref:Uncharacterized protein n=1 Tax=Sphaerodactylus townsendi TaxID=933632 RepID=A0ACB8FYR1_9SAUR